MIPGSHKKNFKLDFQRWGTAGVDTPGALEITGEPGDVMIFNEALVHTGAAKTTARRRTTLQYNHVERLRGRLRHDRLPQCPPLLDAALHSPPLHPGTEGAHRLDGLHYSRPLDRGAEKSNDPFRREVRNRA